MPHGWPDYVAFESPVTVPQGGTGVGSFTAGGVILGNGTGPLVASAAGFGDGARVYNSTDEVVPTGINGLILSFDSERYDSGGLYSGANPQRLTAQRAGKYLITVHVQWDGNATGYRKLYICTSSPGVLAYTILYPAAADPAGQSLATVCYLAALGYAYVLAKQDTGGDLSILASPPFSPEFAMQWLSP